jgi:hypothetical protein
MSAATRYTLTPLAWALERARKLSLTTGRPVRLSDKQRHDIATDALLAGATVTQASQESGLCRATTARICTGLVRRGKRASELHSRLRQKKVAT